MKADIYSSVREQDPSTGIVKNIWALDKTIDCLAKSVLRDTTSSNSDSVALKDELVALSNIVKLRTSMPISSDKRVVAIRNKDGVIWKETDNINSQGGYEQATIFEPRGSTPIMDFTGKVVGYEVFLQRQEIQSLETM